MLPQTIAGKTRTLAKQRETIVGPARPDRAARRIAPRNSPAANNNASPSARALANRPRLLCRRTDRQSRPAHSRRRVRAAHPTRAFGRCSPRSWPRTISIWPRKMDRTLIMHEGRRLHGRELKPKG